MARRDDREYREYLSEEQRSQRGGAGMHRPSNAARLSPRAVKALRDSRPLLDAFGVARVSLFGSFARDEGRQDSDVDLLKASVRSRVEPPVATRARDAVIIAEP